MQIVKEKNLIFTADDFGYDEPFNLAVLKAYKEGLLNSAALMANYEGFSQAVEFVSQMPTCQIGVHLNIIEGNSLSENKTFSDGFISILKKSYDKSYMNWVEKEFRLQIEKVLNKVEAKHLNSHVHVHGIPKIFELTCKLAKEYNINYIRTQFEHPYFLPDIKKYTKLAYPINMIKVTLLDTFTILNKQTLKKYPDITTNDFLIGVNYTADMDVNTVKYGLKAIMNKNKTAEILVHPCFYDEAAPKNQHYKEFQIFMSKELKEEIAKQGWVIKK